MRDGAPKCREEDAMTIRLYELVGVDDRRFSPYCWRTRMALAHKGLAVETIPCRFTDKDKIAFSGQARVPVIRDGAATVSDSWAIACYLEDTYTDAPTLFGDAIGRAEARFINEWADGELHARMIRLVLMDIYEHVDAADRAYFRTSREQRLGFTLEQVAAEREEHRPAFERALSPLRTLLTEQPFVCGRTPAYGDYIVFGAFQWARVISPYRLVEPGDPVDDWRCRMLDLFDGLGRNVPAYSV
jgi:glutathione S-transferase